MGDAATISWDAHGQISSFRIHLSRDSGHSWTTIFPNVGGSERQIAYSVGPAASENCKVRIEALGPAGSASDDSDGFFRIRPGR
jgi:hypothetical protein